MLDLLFHQNGHVQCKTECLLEDAGAGPLGSTEGCLPSRGLKVQEWLETTGEGTKCLDILAYACENCTCEFRMSVLRSSKENRLAAGNFLVLNAFFSCPSFIITLDARRVGYKFNK